MHSAYGAGSNGQPATPSFAPGRLLVAQQPGSTELNFQQALAKAGGRSLGRLYGMTVHVVEVAAGKELDTVARLASSPHVRFAEVDQLVAPGGMVNDPYASSEWHLAKINAPTAWDSATGAGVPNGVATLTAVAYDAAGNSSISSPVSVNISNNAVADTTPPTLTITNPLDGSHVSGVVNIATAVGDNSGAAGITQLLYIDGVLKNSVIGTALSYHWNTRKVAAGPQVIQVTARDQARNSVTAQVQVTK